MLSLGGEALPWPGHQVPVVRDVAPCWLGVLGCGRQVRGPLQQTLEAALKWMQQGVVGSVDQLGLKYKW